MNTGLFDALEGRNDPAEVRLSRPLAACMNAVP